MSKKIYVKENNLIKIKNAMASENTSHSTFMSEDKPPYEKDDFEISGEGSNNDFFHVNESYGFSKNVDLSEIGRVNYTWDFDDDYYLEWLEDNEFADNEDVKLQYIKEGNVEFELDFCDNETYHTIGNDSVYYEDLEDLFGERMAETILKNCIEDGEGYFDTEELYYEDNIDINNPSELDSMAMKILRHGEYYKDCRGFILSNGVVVYTDMEHNEVTRIPGINDKFQFITLGNIRVLDHSIDIGKEPTRQQWEVLKQVLRYYDGEELYLDIFHNNAEIGVHYPVCNPNYVFGEITRFYSEGIKPQGGSFYEQKQVIKENTFEKWFNGSVLVDENGNPIKMYHGTSKKFDSFSKDFINSSGAGAYEGYGFNFTPHWSTAAHYSTDGNIIEAYLSVKHPLKSTENTLSVNTVMKAIAEIDKGVPVTDRIVAMYEQPNYKEKWDEVYYRRALRKAAQSIVEYNGNDYGNAGIYAGVCESGQGDPRKTIEVFERLGYDSAIFYDDNGKIRTVIVFEPNQIKLANNKTFTIDSDVMSENIESEVEASQVKLDSFKKRNELVPKIWDGDKLNSRVRLKLLDIADDFWESTNIGWVKPKGIVLMGSICNYNWSKFSDIDLHLQVDFSEIDNKKDFVQEYFNGKKNEWNKEHSDLKIFDFPVELYVEDLGANTNSGGIYDLEKNDWIKKPSKESIKPIGLNKYSIKDKAAKIMTDIDDLYDAFKNTDDDAKLRKIGKKAHKILDYVKSMRKKGLDRGGESDSGNIIYKVIRRTGYMDILWNLSSKLYDKLNSINESTENDIDYFALAKEYFGVTNDIRECGYILPDGAMLDFTGRHMLKPGTDSSHLKGRRSIDHREINSIGWSDDGNVKNFDFSMSQFIKMGAIRIHCSNNWSSINLFKKPTREQINPLLRLIQYSKGNVTVEIGDGDNSYEYAEWDEANPRRVVNDVIRYFDGETINLVGNVTESKIIEIAEKYIRMSLNEEVVADGNADHNPFKQRWKHEREVLINYLLNYGELMTSKENGKQYRVLFDDMLSNRIGMNYCLCIQWNPLTMEPGNVIYVRAYDKFTKKIFKPEFDTRGFDNIAGTIDDVNGM